MGGGRGQEGGAGGNLILTDAPPAPRGLAPEDPGQRKNWGRQGPGMCWKFLNRGQPFPPPTSSPPAQEKLKNRGVASAVCLGGTRLRGPAAQRAGPTLPGPPSPALWRGEGTGSPPQAEASASLGETLTSGPPDRSWPLSSLWGSRRTCPESFRGVSACRGALLSEPRCTRAGRADGGLVCPADEEPDPPAPPTLLLRSVASSPRERGRP